MPATPEYDLLIVGSGPIGAVVANSVRAGLPAARIGIIESGPSISPRAGEHLIETEADSLRDTYQMLMRAALQLAYVREGAREAGMANQGDWTAESPGVVPAAYLAHDMSQFPGAAFAWNVGGMGVHWTAAAPWPSGPELIPGIPLPDWERDLAQARRLFRVGPDAYVANPLSGRIIEALRSAVPTDVAGREAQAMPMAGEPLPDGRLARTGPRDIFPEMERAPSGRFELLSRSLCTRVIVERGRTSGVVVKDLETGEMTELRATAVVVAADALRTPQLLWASEVRPAALGRYLNEHSSISGEVLIDTRRLGAADSQAPSFGPDEPFVGAYWSPSVGTDNPTHGQMMETLGEDGQRRLGLSWYARTDLSEDNGLEFSDTEADALGLPKMSVRFRYSDRDLDRVEIAKGRQGAVGSSLGEFDPAASQLLPPGASLHYTGTTRAGLHDDGASVVDLDGRVWNLDGLFLAGNGVIPTALACNSTLMSAALAVRTGRAVVDHLRAGSSSRSMLGAGAPGRHDRPVRVGQESA